ncbi:hypothetical protein LINPERPRIM_LOCUS25607 [Linum perenne]
MGGAAPTFASAVADSAPAPAPSKSADAMVDDDGQVAVGEDESEGMGHGKKVGIAFGLVAMTCMVGFRGIIYRKRQENIRRVGYRYVAGTELLGRSIVDMAAVVFIRVKRRNVRRRLGWEDL